MEKESIKKNKAKEEEKGDEERKKKTRIKRESTLYKVRELHVHATCKDVSIELQR